MASAACRLIPIVVLTSSGEQRDIRATYKLGVNSYIQKPVDYHKFAEAIRRLGLFITLLLVPPVNGSR